MCLLIQQEVIKSSRDLVDGSGAILLQRVVESPDVVQQQPMTWDSLAYLATVLVRLRPNGPEEEQVRSRSVSREAFTAGRVGTNQRSGD